MKKYLIIFLFVGLFVPMVSGCVYIERIEPAVVDSFIIEKDSFYLSGVTIKEDRRVSDYITRLSYPSATDSLLSSIYAREVVFQDEAVLPSKFVDSKHEDDIVHIQYRFDYVFSFSEFKVSVPFVVDKAYLEQDGKIWDMPYHEPLFELGEIRVSDMPDEKIGEKEYYVSNVSCTAKMLIGPQTIYSTVCVNVLTEKEEIYYAPTIDDYEDENIGASF